MPQFAAARSLAALEKPEEVEVLVRAVARAVEAWNLTGQEAADLFDVPLATWNRMKAGTFKGKLDRDKVTRASLIIGIYKGLRLLFNGPLTYGWPKTGNSGPLFGGRPPLAVMIAGGIPALMSVRQHIDALRGGL
ncbi:MAG: antitoxin Xre-like helix-turn-helix domain-containing protein [Kiloniellales bacterium]|nr:antitoxin Xre-like helix-turn-helix domain-containing protein [Kiloniellales bacterium]